MSPKLPQDSRIRSGDISLEASNLVSRSQLVAPSYYVTEDFSTVFYRTASPSEPLPYTLKYIKIDTYTLMYISRARKTAVHYCS